MKSKRHHVRPETCVTSVGVGDASFPSNVTSTSVPSADYRYLLRRPGEMLLRGVWRGTLFATLISPEA